MCTHACVRVCMGASLACRCLKCPEEDVSSGSSVTGGCRCGEPNPVICRSTSVLTCGAISPAPLVMHFIRSITPCVENTRASSGQAGSDSRAGQSAGKTPSLVRRHFMFFVLRSLLHHGRLDLWLPEQDQFPSEKPARC